jgi:hypothetical protein
MLAQCTWAGGRGETWAAMVPLAAAERQAPLGRGQSPPPQWWWCQLWHPCSTPLYPTVYTGSLMKYLWNVTEPQGSLPLHRDISAGAHVPQPGSCGLGWPEAWELRMAFTLFMQLGKKSKEKCVVTWKWDWRVRLCVKCYRNTAMLICLHTVSGYVCPWRSREEIPQRPCHCRLRTFAIWSALQSLLTMAPTPQWPGAVALPWVSGNRGRAGGRWEVGEPGADVRRVLVRANGNVQLKQNTTHFCFCYFSYYLK